MRCVCADACAQMRMQMRVCRCVCRCKVRKCVAHYRGLRAKAARASISFRRSLFRSFPEKRRENESESGRETKKSPLPAGKML